MPATSQEEIAARERFAFGENWQRFLSLLDESRVLQAEDSLRRMLEVSDLRGKTFIDIGCGSGLFSLAARRLGARVQCFDYDPQSVACAQELRRRYFPQDPDWRVEEGSALDTGYLGGLGSFDVVYSWGVLHHTGAMWHGLDYEFWPITGCQRPVSTNRPPTRRAHSASSKAASAATISGATNDQTSLPRCTLPSCLRKGFGNCSLSSCQSKLARTAAMDKGGRAVYAISHRVKCRTDHPCRALLT